MRRGLERRKKAGRIRFISRRAAAGPQDGVLRTRSSRRSQAGRELLFALQPLLLLLEHREAPKPASKGARIRRRRAAAYGCLVCLAKGPEPEMLSAPRLKACFRAVSLSTPRNFLLDERRPVVSRAGCSRAASLSSTARARSPRSRRGCAVVRPARGVAGSRAARAARLPGRRGCGQRPATGSPSGLPSGGLAP